MTLVNVGRVALLLGKVDVMAVDDSWMGILTELLTDPSSKLKVRRMEPGDAGSSWRMGHYELMWFVVSQK